MLASTHCASTQRRSLFWEWTVNTVCIRDYTNVFNSSNSRRTTILYLFRYCTTTTTSGPRICAATINPPRSAFRNPKIYTSRRRQQHRFSRHATSTEVEPVYIEFPSAAVCDWLTPSGFIRLLQPNLRTICSRDSLTDGPAPIPAAASFSPTQQHQQY